MFDEYLYLPPCVDPQVPAVIALEPAVSTDTPSSMTINQDVPSTKPSSKESSSQVIIPNNVHSVNQPPKHINKWTKDQPLDNSPGGIFLNQSKYALESLKKYGMETCDPVDTPMVEKSKLDEDPQGKAVDPTRYRGMIGTLMYLTSNRPDLVFDVCMCAQY
ncbi:hypothetical protein Tco_1520183 [Tanacetum coccineum]